MQSKEKTFTARPAAILTEQDLHLPLAIAIGSLCLSARPASVLVLYVNDRGTEWVQKGMGLFDARNVERLVLGISPHPANNAAIRRQRWLGRNVCAPFQSMQHESHTLPPHPIPLTAGFSTLLHPIYENFMFLTDC